MNKERSHLPPTPRSCSSPSQKEKTGYGSSRNSDSPIHWETLTGSHSPKIAEIRPSSWDNSDDELSLTLERDNTQGHIYSSETHSNRKSVSYEINELKKQFFQSLVMDTGSEIEGMREMSSKYDRRQSPARVRRRTKSSSSSSTVMDASSQSPPKREEEAVPPEILFDNIENITPILELDSRFYLDNFFSELRRKRISMLESTVGVTEERDESFPEMSVEDTEDFFNISEVGYFTRTARKLSKILEVEENKKDSDREAEECSENADMFSKFSRKLDYSDYSSPQTAQSKNKEALFENLKNKDNEFKSSKFESKNSKKPEQMREYLSGKQGLDIAKELGKEVISLTTKTGTINLNSPKWEDIKKNNADLSQIHDDEDINWNLIENLKLDLMKSSENPTPRKSTRREQNTRSGSRKSTKDERLQSPKFMINIGKESSRSLKVEDIKTPNSVGKNSVPGSERSIRDEKSSCSSADHEGEKNTFRDPKSPSLGSRISNRSLELENILLEQGLNTDMYSHRSAFTNGVRDQAETSYRSELSKQLELPCQSNHSESSRSVNSKSSRSSRSNRLSSRADESRLPSHRSDKLEPLEREESRRSSFRSPKTELELLNTPLVGKSSDRESTKSTPKIIQSTKTSSPCVVEVCIEPKNCSETSNNNEGILHLGISRTDEEEIDNTFSSQLEKFLVIQSSSHSEMVNSESLDKATRDDSMEVEEMVKSSRQSSQKSLIIENLDSLNHITSSRSMKSKSRQNSCASEERTVLNINLNFERSDDVKTSGKSTDRSGIHGCEDSAVQRLKNNSESDRRLSVIDEASFEDIEFSNAFESPGKSNQSSVASSEVTDKKKTHKNQSASHKSVKKQTSKESVTKPKAEGLWNELIETFREDRNQPFNWEDHFLAFLKPNKNGSISTGREPSSPAAEKNEFLNFEKMQDDIALSRRLTENIIQPFQKSEEISSAGKRPEKKENFTKNLDLDSGNNSTEKIKTDEPQNIYCFAVEKTGNFQIGESGDFTCWNLGVSHILEEGKPKDHGDGTRPQYHKRSAMLNEDLRETESKNQRKLWTNSKKDIRNSNTKIQKNFLSNDDLDLVNLYQTDLKSSKSDNCLRTIYFSKNLVVDFSTKKNKSDSEQKPFFFENPRERKAESFKSQVQYSSSECASDETDIHESDFEKIRRSASLKDIAGKLRKIGNEKPESDEKIYNSKSRLFDKTKDDTKNNESTNLNIFLAHKKQEDQTVEKTNWLILKQSRGKKSHREKKKSKSRVKIDKRLIRKDSKEYLSFRSRQSIPALKLRNSNCFQNFYKRVISVFCLTSNSSLPTSQ